MMNVYQVGTKLFSAADAPTASILAEELGVTDFPVLIQDPNLDQQCEAQDNSVAAWQKRAERAIENLSKL